MLNAPVEHERMSAYDYRRFRIQTAIRLLRNDPTWPESAMNFLEQTEPTKEPA